MSVKAKGSNPILEFSLNHEFPEYGVETGVKKVVTFGDASHKCPTYVNRVPPCQVGCPSGEDIRGFHNLLRGVEKSEDKWVAAWKRIVEKNPFPAIMGRVCPHPCETSCNRVQVDETVAINAVEHAIGDYGLENNLELEKPSISTGKTVAVVGGGPAGLSAAYQLVQKGHQITLFDDREKLGGMMRYGIMDYRVDRKVLDMEIQKILDLGVETKMNTRIGRDITLEELKEKYDAVFIGIGAQKGHMLPVPGFGESAYTTNAIDFLADFEKNQKGMTIGENLMVIGDGNVSMDVVRLAVRLGKKATVLSAVDRDDMACYDLEFEESMAEGVQAQFMVGASEVVLENGKVVGLKVTQMQKKEAGEEGANSPVPFLRYKPVPGSEKVIDCDMVVASIGQTTDFEGMESIKPETPWLKVDKNFRLPGEEKVFGGGDVLKIDIITTCVGHGRKAASAIHNYLNGVDDPAAKFEEVAKFEKLYTYYFEKSEMNPRKHLHVDKIEGNWDETVYAPDEEATLAESERCMSCGMCFECRQCEHYCPQDAISYFRNNGVGEVMYTDYGKCVGCTICAEVCPTGYIHMGMGEDL